MVTDVHQAAKGQGVAGGRARTTVAILLIFSSSLVSGLGRGICGRSSSVISVGRVTTSQSSGRR